MGTAASGTFRGEDAFHLGLDIEALDDLHRADSQIVHAITVPHPFIEIPRIGHAGQGG